MAASAYLILLPWDPLGVLLGLAQEDVRWISGCKQVKYKKNYIWTMRKYVT